VSAAPWRLAQDGRDSQYGHAQLRLHLPHSPHRPTFVRVSLRAAARLPGAAGHHRTPARRLSPSAGPPAPFYQRATMDLLLCKIRARHRHRRSMLHRPGLRYLPERPRRSALHPDRNSVSGTAVWLALDSSGSAQTLPGMLASALEPGSRRPGLLQFPFVEWHGALLRARPRIHAHPGTAHQLVQYAAMALPRFVVAQSLPGGLFAIARRHLTTHA